MHLYSALCIVVHPKRFTIMWGGGVSPQPPPVCSIHLDDATAASGQRHQCAHHTPATGGEERESQNQSSVCAHHTPATGGEEREPIKLYALHQQPANMWRGERVEQRANQVYALTTHQSTGGEDRSQQSQSECVRSPQHRATGGRGEAESQSHQV